jgi:hypothetical protein
MPLQRRSLAAAPQRAPLQVLLAALLLAARLTGAQAPADPGAPQLLTSLPTCGVQASPEAVGVLPAGGSWAGQGVRQEAPRAMRAEPAQPHLPHPGEHPNPPPHTCTGIPPPSDGAGDANGSAGCSIVLPELARGEAAAYEFGVAPGSEMTMLFLLRARGGRVAMSVRRP